MKLFTRDSILREVQREHVERGDKYVGANTVKATATHLKGHMKLTLP